MAKASSAEVSGRVGTIINREAFGAELAASAHRRRPCSGGCAENVEYTVVGVSTGILGNCSSEGATTERSLFLSPTRSAWLGGSRRFGPLGKRSHTSFIAALIYGRTTGKTTMEMRSTPRIVTRRRRRQSGCAGG